jgi:hypothetical protein
MNIVTLKAFISMFPCCFAICLLTSIPSTTISQDKAAVLAYLRLKHKDPYKGYILCAIVRKAEFRLVLCMNTISSVANCCMECPRRKRVLCLHGPKGHAQCFNCPGSYHNYSIGCQFRVSSARLFSVALGNIVLIGLVSAGVTRRPCHPAPFRGMTRQVHLQIRTRLLKIPPASRRQVRRRHRLPVHALAGEAGPVQTVPSLSIPSQGSPYAPHLFSTGSPCLAQSIIAPTTVSYPQLKSWAGPSSTL